MIKPHLSCNGLPAYCMEIAYVGNLQTLESGKNEKNTVWLNSNIPLTVSVINVIIIIIITRAFQPYCYIVEF
jgi:hypothetical protein